MRDLSVPIEADKCKRTFEDQFIFVIYSAHSPEGFARARWIATMSCCR